MVSPRSARSSRSCSPVSSPKATRLGAKNIERVGDHTTNIAETVHFLVRGFNITDDRPKDDQTSSTLISGT
jgi:phosphate uptake regulator